MNPPSRKAIGAWLKKSRQRARVVARRRGERDYSVERVAARLNVAEKTVRLWESGATSPPADQFIALVMLYSADVSELSPQSSAAEADIDRDIKESRSRLGKQAGKKPGRSANGGRR